jgi:HemK-like putative methylase
MHLERNPGSTRIINHPKYVYDIAFKDLKQIIRFSRERYELEKPLQYILGDVSFAELNLLVEPPILIPRPETEEMVRWIAKKCKENVIDRKIRILDIGCGSGCISLGMAKLLEDDSAEIIGIDMNPVAIDLSRRNLHRNASSISNRVHFELIDVNESNFSTIRTKLGGPFDLIISNPPYIPIHHWKSLDLEVKLWEDSQALIAGQSGNEFYALILQWIFTHKLLDQQSPFSMLVFEIGYDYQHVFISHHTHNMLNCVLYSDQYQKSRWVCCCKA